LKNGKVPAFLKGAQFQIEEDESQSEGSLSSSDNFLLGEIDDEEGEIASGIAADMQCIKDRLRVETEFDGIDEWDLKEEEFERAMELGLLPLPMVADYVADMVILAKCRKLGRPIPYWAVQLIEASNFVQRRWREKAKQYKFKGHAAAVDSLFGDMNFSDFTSNKSAAPPPTVSKKKEASEKAEDRFWKAYLQHVKRMHVGQQGQVESDSVFEERVEKTMTKLKSVKYLKHIESFKHQGGLALTPSANAANRGKATRSKAANSKPRVFR